MHAPRDRAPKTVNGVTEHRPPLMIHNLGVSDKLLMLLQKTPVARGSFAPCAAAVPRARAPPISTSWFDSEG